MSIINKDQKRRIKISDPEKEAELIFIKLISAFAIFAVVITTITALSISNARASNNPIHKMADRGDLIISDDMDDYLHKQGHEQLYLLEDLE